MMNIDGWEHASRRIASGVVAIIAITDDGKIMLVEQYRPPLGRLMIELPAGLAGDLTDAADEDLQTAAERELLEETGYRAARWRQIGDGASSSGLTNNAVQDALSTSKFTRCCQALLEVCNGPESRS
ncbi:NUDIX hydrolase [Planctomycetales bacterium ZRK34]|nr:NUDIX hydrolase [Planctomycetales bacterium ZRK34]